MASPLDTSSLADLGEEYDYIVVGGGTSGLVVASRLTEDKNKRVLVLEAGDNRVHDDKIRIQPLMASTFADLDYDWCVVTEPQIDYGFVEIKRPASTTEDSACHLARPSGGLVSMSTPISWVETKKKRGNPLIVASINGGVVLYPNASTFDTREKLGNPGWGWSDIGPYFRKLHTNTGSKRPKLNEEYMLEHAVPAAQGTDGPLPVSYGSGEGFPPFYQAWPRAWATLTGRSMNGDPISGRGTGAFNHPATLNPDTYERSFAANTYWPEDVARQRPNLRVVTEALVNRIIFERHNAGGSDPRATGVELIAKDGNKRTVRANHEVILAAGAVKTQQLLELSGVGNRSLLSQHSIDVLADNPNVGENLQDHGLVPCSWEVADPAHSGDMLRDPALAGAAVEAFQKHRAGALTVNPIASAYQPLLDPEDPSEPPLSVAGLFTELDQANAQPRALCQMSLADADETLAQYELPPLQLNTLQGDDVRTILGLGAPGFFASIVAVLNHPFSRGSSHIRSAEPDATPTVDPRAMTHPLDLELHARHILILVRLRETEPLKSLVKEGGKRLHNGGKRMRCLRRRRPGRRLPNVLTTLCAGQKP